MGSIIICLQNPFELSYLESVLGVPGDIKTPQFPHECYRGDLIQMTMINYGKYDTIGISIHFGQNDGFH